MTLKPAYLVFLIIVFMLTIMTIFCSTSNNKTIDRSSTQIQKFYQIENTRSAGQNNINILKPGYANRHIHESPETDVVIKGIRSEENKSGLQHAAKLKKKQNVNEPLFFHSKIDPGDLLIETGN